jgi:(p)ppGpp synthase/HD superfamily hydrolase
LLFFKNKIKRSPSNNTEDVFKQELSSNYDLLVFGKEQDRLEYKLSNCCNPIPGDSVFGFVTINEGIKVHKKEKVKNKQEEKEKRKERLGQADILTPARGLISFEKKMRK